MTGAHRLALVSVTAWVSDGVTRITGITPTGDITDILTGTDTHTGDIIPITMKAVITIHITVPGRAWQGTQLIHQTAGEHQPAGLQPRVEGILHLQPGVMGMLRPLQPQEESRRHRCDQPPGLRILWQHNASLLQARNATIIHALPANAREPTAGIQDKAV